MKNELIHSRRSMLGTMGGSMLSVAAIGVLGNTSVAHAMNHHEGDASGDVAILNVALGLEHEAIAAYQIGAESGLLEKGVLDVAVLFQGHHKGHRDALIGAIESMGGSPVESKSTETYVAELDIANTVKGQADVLKLARKLERGAANAYLGVIPSFMDSGLKQISGRLAADEATHWALLNNALGDAYPSDPLIFGG
ncbi:MAG: ferritin-like domain-containing protein [Blastomonas sp.]